MIALWCVLIGFGIRGFQDLSHRVNTTGLQTPGTPSAQYVHWVHQFSPAINDLTLDVLIHRRNTAQAFNSFSPLIAAIHHHVPQWSVEDIQQRGPWTAIIWSTGTAHWIPALSQYAASEQTLTAIVRHFDRITQDTTFVTGAVPLQWTFSRLAIRALENAARFTLPMTLILLLVVFQSWSAALFVPLSAMSGSLIGLGVLGLWPTSIPVTSFTTEAGMMLGLGVGIDYGMMWWASLQRTDPDTNIVIRYVMAQQRVRQMVIPAAAIVILSLMALMFFSQPLITSIALGVIFAVTGSAMASLSVLPALLWIVRARPKRLTSLSGKPAFWTRLQGFLLNRYRVVAAGVIIVLLVFSSGTRALVLWEPGVATLPQSESAVQGFRILQKQFPIAAGAPIMVAIGPPHSGGNMYNRREFGNVLSSLRHTEGIRRVQPITPILPAMSKTPTVTNQQRRATVHLVAVWSSFPNSSPLTIRLVPTLRQRLTNGFQLKSIVGGGAAEVYDAIHRVFHRFLWVFAIISLVSGAGLYWRFRSLLISVSAIIFNALSTATSLGVLIAVFQHHAGAWMGLPSPGALQWTTPVLLFAILYAVSTDYEIFYVEAVSHHRQANRPLRELLLAGTQETGGFLTGAAIIMVSVFMAFGLSGLEFMQELGIGLSVAVLIDATVVRMVLVPSFLLWFQQWSWWPGGKKRSPMFLEVP